MAGIGVVWRAAVPGHRESEADMEWTTRRMVPLRQRRNIRSPGASRGPAARDIVLRHMRIGRSAAPPPESERKLG
jgi:hypothetical protein